MITVTFDEEKMARAVMKEAMYVAEKFGYVTLADIYDLAGISYSKDDAMVRYSTDDISKMFDITESNSMSCLIIYDPQIVMSVLVKACDEAIIRGDDQK